MSSIARQGTRNISRISGPDRATGAHAFVFPRLLRKPVRKMLRWLTSGEAVSVRNLVTVCAISGMIGGATLVAMNGGAAPIVAKATALAGIKIGDVQVSGGKEVTKIDVLTALDLGTERSLFTFDVHKARDDLKNLPWVADATVWKAYPDKLMVKLVERKPFAVWQRGAELWLISRDGHQIVPFDDRFAGLPLVVGPGANTDAAEIVALASRYRDVGERASAYVRVGARRWNIALDNGITVLLPEREVERSLIRLRELQEDRDLFARDIDRIDLRLADRLVVRLTEGGFTRLEEMRKARAEQAKRGSES